MFFSAIGLVLVVCVLLLARAQHLEDMTGGWRMALYGALGLFFGGFFADGKVSEEKLPEYFNANFILYR